MTDELRMTGLLAGLPPIPADTPWVQVLEKVYVQMQLKTLDYADKLRIYTHLDDVSEEVLDVLAVQFKVDWYSQSWPLETKRRVIKTALEVRRYYGTDWATETALRSIYPGSKIIEWYDYGGTPGHFIVECDISDSWEQPSIAEIKRITNIYKRMTAHLEHIRFTVTAERPVTAYAVGALTGTAGRMTVILPGKIEPRPVKVAAYAGAAPGGIAARMTVPIHGTIRQKEIRVTGYAAAKTAATAMRLTAAINGKIEQRDITVRGFAAAKATETVQRIEVKVKGGNT